MEIEKVFGVFKEVSKEEDEYNLQKELNTLLSHINSNNSSAADAQIQEIKRITELSVVNKYSSSKLKILEYIDAINLFGDNLWVYLENILNTESYKLKDNLSNLISQRNTKINEIKTAIQHLESLDFVSYYEKMEDYELGLIIPEEESDLKKVQKYLEDWCFIIKHVSELCGNDYSEPKISSVSSSSIEIFLIETYIVTICVLGITERVVNIYEKINKIKILKKELEELDIKKTLKELDDKIKDIINTEKEKIVVEVISEHETKIKQNRRGELKNAITKSVEKIINMYDKGIIIEATPPKVEEPEILKEEETDDNKREWNDAKKNYDDKLNQVKEVTGIISNVAKTLKELTSAGKETLQLSQYIDSNNELESENNNPEQNSK